MPIANRYRVGDRVAYVKKCHDHDHCYPIDRLVLGKTYTVKEVQGDSVCLKECSWWVQDSCVIFASEAAPFDEEKYKREQVIAKIKQLDKRFKNRHKNDDSDETYETPYSHYDGEYDGEAYV